MVSTGVQGFWNYDVFSLLGPMSGRPQSEAMGFVNTHFKETKLNLCFTQTDVVMKFHNNPPFITRAYNSTVDPSDPNIRGGVSLVGKDWMMNYEYCVIEGLDVGEDIEHVWEIDTTRCVNEWTYSAGPPETFTPPTGILRAMSKPDSNTYEIVTRDYFTYRFTYNEHITGSSSSNSSKVYALEYIEDRNGVRVYVDWESPASGDDRIKAIQVSLDSGTTRYDVIRFEYDETEPGLIKRYRMVPVDDLPSSVTVPSWITDAYWEFTYDQNGYMTKVEYPPGAEGRASYTFEYDTDEFTVYDMLGTKHTFYYDDIAEDWRREIWAKGAVSNYSRVIYDDSAANTTTITTETTEFPDRTWTLEHNGSGNLEDITDPLSKVTACTWVSNQLTEVVLPDIESASGSIESKVQFAYHATTKNLLTVKWWKDGTENGRYRIAYTYGSGDCIYDIVKVSMDIASNPGHNFTETEFEYDSNHNLTLIRAGMNPDISDETDPEDMSIAAVTRFAYTDEGNIDSVTGPEGGKVGFCYKSDVSKGEYGGLEKINEYLSDGVTTTALTTYVSWFYFDCRVQSVTTAGPTPTILFTYTTIGELVKMEVTEGPSHEIKYDRMSNPIELKGPDGSTYIDFDLLNTPLNLPCTVIAPSPCEDENKTTITYHENGAVWKSTFRYDGDEYETEYSYDELFRLSSISREYVSGGATETITLAYDDNSDLISITDNGSNETKLYYNLVGAVEMICLPGDDDLTTPTRWERIIHTYEGPMGLCSKTTFKYGAGQDQNEAVHQFFYDRLGRLVKWVKPETVYELDIPDPETEHTYTYTDNFYYDRNSNIIMVINRTDDFHDPATDITETRSYYEYDGFGRLVKAKIEYDEEKTLDVGYYFDIYGNLLESTSGGMSTIRMEYDDQGRLIGVYKPGQKSNQGTKYEYVPTTGKLTKTTYPDGQASEMNYNPDGSTASVTKGNVATIPDECKDSTSAPATAVIPGTTPVTKVEGDTKTFNREYYENGWLKRIIFPNGDYIGYSYDGFGRIIKVYESVPEQDPSVSDSDLPFGTTDDTAITLSIEYEWIQDTPNNDILKVTYSTYKSGDDYQTEYFFDPRGRLKAVQLYIQTTYGGASTQHLYNYMYDGRGNLTIVDYDSGVLIANSYNHLNQLITQVAGTVINSYRYSCYSLIEAKQSCTPVTHSRNILFTYDKVERLLREDISDFVIVDLDPLTSERVDKNFEFQYDNASRLVRIKDPYYENVENDPMQTRISREENRFLGTVERTDTNNPVKGHAESYNHFFDEIGRLRKVDFPDIVETEEDDFGANQASISLEYEYEDNGAVKSVTATSLRDGEEIYFISYTYDANTRMIERVVREKSTSGGWYNWATFKYDGRGQIIEEKYTYSETGATVIVPYKATCAYDLAGNVTERKIETDNGGSYLEFSSFSYSRGYQLMRFEVTDGTTTWAYEFTYDTRGNVLSCAIAGATPPFLFPSFTYDNFNNVATYTAGGTTWHLWRDPLGRVFRKADSSGVDPDVATHYYYAFNALAQEYDMSITAVNDDIEFDYLRGFNGRVLRQRDIDETQDRQPIRDILGSAINVCNADEAEMSQNTSGYTFDAWGESFAAGDADGQPAETNHIRYHGAFTEEFVSSGDTDGVYRMGARHYSTVLGRFFQREPMTLIGPPNPTCPLSANPYIYSHNSPTTMSDISGLSEIGMTSTYNEGILTPPPPGDDPQPFVPLPDPDPGFTPPEDIGPKMPEAMEFRIPGMNPFPWWDRRNPDIPLPSNPWGWSTMSLTIPDDPGPPGTTPLIPPDLFRPKKPPGGFGGPSGKPGMPPIELMGASSGGGDTSFNSWNPGSGFWGYFMGSEHHQKGPIDTGSGKGGPYGYAPMVNASAGSTKSGVGEQSDEDFDQAWEDQGFGWKYATPGLVLVGIGIAGIAGISFFAGIGSTWAMSIVGRSGAMRLFGLGRFIYNKGFNKLVNAARKKYPNYGIRIEKHHIFPFRYGGPKTGPTVPLDAAYHQTITNAWHVKYKVAFQFPKKDFVRAAIRINRMRPLPYGTRIAF